jgi:hypothetical protein
MRGTSNDHGMLDGSRSSKHDFAWELRVVFEKGLLSA